MNALSHPTPASRAGSRPLGKALAGLLLAALLSSAHAGAAAPAGAGARLDVAASGDDLVVSLTFPDGGPLPTAAALALATTGGREIARQDVTPTVGDQTVLLPGALARFQADGWIYHLSLEDGAGGLLDRLSFDVVLQCSTSQSCTLATRAGAAAPPGSQLVSGPMRDALDLAAAHPSGNLLAQIRTQSPALTGDTYTYGSRLAQLAASGPTQPAVGSCFCSWMSTPLPQPGVQQISGSINGALWTQGVKGPGALHKAQAEYHSASRTGYVSGKSRSSQASQLMMGLRCNVLTAWTSRIIYVNGKPTVVQEPVLGDECAKCKGTVDNHAEYDSLLTVSTRPATLGPSSVYAAAYEEAAYSVNGVTIFTRSDNVAHNGNADDSQSPHGFGDSTVAEPANASLSTTGEAYVQGVYDDHGSAKAANSYLMAMHGHAACAFPPDAALWSDDSQLDSGKGPLIANLKNYFAGFGMTVDP